MSFDLSQFKSRVITPARPTLFRVGVILPGTSIPEFEFICEAASTPGVINMNYPIFYQGRQIQYAGDKQYSAWSVTVINEEGNPTRAQFEDWFELINGTRSGVRDGGFSTSLDYKGVAEVVQETHTGFEPDTGHYYIEGLFPIELGEMALAWKDVDQYQTFDVKFVMDWWSTSRTPG